MTTTLDDIDLGALPDELGARDAAMPRNGSLIEQLRAQRAAAKPIPFDIILPDWGAETGGVKIIIRLRRVALEGRAERAGAILQHALLTGKTDDRELAAACDLMIAGLDQIYGQAPDADEAEPLDPDHPLKFDQRTADLLGLDLPEGRSRAVVSALFGGAVGRARIIGAAKSYYVYLTNVEVDDEGKG